MTKDVAGERRYLSLQRKEPCSLIRISIVAWTSTSTISTHRYWSWPLSLSSSLLVCPSSSRSRFSAWSCSMWRIEFVWRTGTAAHPYMTTRWTKWHSRCSGLPRSSTLEWAHGYIQTSRLSSPTFRLKQAQQSSCLRTTTFQICTQRLRQAPSLSSTC